MNFAEAAFGIAIAIGIDYEDVRVDLPQDFNKIEDAGAGVDEGVLHVADCLHHIEAFLFRSNRLPTFQQLKIPVGTNADVEVAVLGSLLKKADMPGIEHVEEPGDKHLW